MPGNVHHLPHLRPSLPCCSSGLLVFGSRIGVFGSRGVFSSRVGVFGSRGVFGSQVGFWFPRGGVFSVPGSVFSVPAGVFSSCDGVFGARLALKREKCTDVFGFAVFFVCFIV